VVGLDVLGNVTLGALDGLEHERHLLALLAHLDHVADPQAVARDGDAAAVDRDMAVADELARGEHGRHELGAVDERSSRPIRCSDVEPLRRVASV